ncbi:MAG: 5'/3'-nucleotidase SurE [Simkaniaceae bacterium]|nr:5'/3'-nucleotidase SurE [Simkaniaceae bacterium]
MKRRPHILITNDDGINAPGIWHLFNALKKHADLTIIAPDSQQSAKGVSLTLKMPLRSSKVSWNGATAYKVCGTPADCVKIALTCLLDSPPDMIVSGINQGCNSGRNVLYSGTIGALIEGTFRQIPGIAFSCREYFEPQFAAYENFIPPIVEHFFDHPAPQGTLINVNFPSETGEAIKGIRYVRQGLGYWVEDHRSSKDGEHDFGVKWEHFGEDEESDVYNLRQGFITATPLHVADLTDLDHLKSHKELFESIDFGKAP